MTQMLPQNIVRPQDELHTDKRCWSWRISMRLLNPCWHGIIMPHCFCRWGQRNSWEVTQPRRASKSTEVMYFQLLAPTYFRPSWVHWGSLTRLSRWRQSAARVSRRLAISNRYWSSKSQSINTPVSPAHHSGDEASRRWRNYVDILLDEKIPHPVICTCTQMHLSMSSSSSSPLLRQPA